MAEFALIACRVSLEKKALVQRLAACEGITESALVRQLLDVVLRTAALEKPPAFQPPEPVNRDAQVRVYMEPGDLQLLNEHAKGRGLTAATYLSYLAHSHLRGVTPIPKTEHTLLEQALTGLRTIERVLKRIEAGSAAGHQTPSGKVEFASMLKIAEGLRDHIKGLLDDNHRSWRDGYAKTPP